MTYSKHKRLPRGSEEAIADMAAGVEREHPAQRCVQFTDHVMTAYARQFSPPVRLALSRAGNVAHAVTSPEKAAEILLTDWPTNWTPKHLAARKAVLKAMESAYTAASIARARKAFAEAADEAGILLSEPPKSVAREGFKSPDLSRREGKMKRDG